MSLLRSFQRFLFVLILVFIASPYLRLGCGFNKQTPLFFAMSQPQTVDVAATVTKAIEFHKSGDIKNALLHYEIALPLLAGNTKASIHGNAGALYMQQGDFEKAKVHFEASVETNPNNSQTHFNLAVLLTSKLNQHAKAIKHCGLALKLDPQNHKAQHLMGNIMQSIGRPDEAEKYFLLAENIALEKEQNPQNIDTKATTSITNSTINGVKLNNWDKNEVLTLLPGESITMGIDNQEYELKCVSNNPYIFTIDHFISARECKHIMNKAESTLEKSFIMGGNSKNSVYADKNNEKKSDNINPSMDDSMDDSNAYRSSYNTWLTADTVLHNIQLKLSLILGIPLPYIKQKSEDLQVVQYHGISLNTTETTTEENNADVAELTNTGDLKVLSPHTTSKLPSKSGQYKQVHGGQFKVHHDSSAFHTRYLTALVYLNDITSSEERNDSAVSAQDTQDCVVGGETWFPYATAENAEDSESIGASRLDSVFKAVTAAETIEAANLRAIAHYDQVIESAGGAGSSEGSNNIHDRLSGVKVTPQQGRVVIFFNHNPETGEIDPKAVHAGLPVRICLQTTEPQNACSASSVPRSASASSEAEEGVVTTRLGDKWVANYWIQLDKKLLAEM